MLDLIPQLNSEVASKPILWESVAIHAHSMVAPLEPTSNAQTTLATMVMMLMLVMDKWSPLYPFLQTPILQFQRSLDSVSSGNAPQAMVMPQSPSFATGSCHLLLIRLLITDSMEHPQQPVLPLLLTILLVDLKCRELITFKMTGRMLSEALPSHLLPSLPSHSTSSEQTPSCKTLPQSKQSESI